MSKKIILFFISIIFFSGFKLTYADVVINEIMYAPESGSDYEWVEIFNSGDAPVDLQGWRFFHGETNSGPLTLRNGSTTILQSSEYAIIAKSPSVVTNYNWLDPSLVILSASTVSLPDSGDNTYIAIASDINKTISNSLIYDTSLGGNKDSGNSLSKINNIWKGAAPTPGETNETIISLPVPNPSGSGGSSSSLTSSSSATETKTKITEEPKVKTKITAETLVFAGIPVEFKANATGYYNEPLSYGKYFWNFGDGDSREVKMSDSQKFTHAYFYPGEYNVNLEYYLNYYGDAPDAFDKVIIKVMPTDILISKVGDEKDFFIELSNNTNYDADISKWILLSDRKIFSFPQNTIIGTKKKIIISSKITDFFVEDKNSLKLTTPQGEVVFDYPSSVIPAVPVKTMIKPQIPISQDTRAMMPREDYLKNENSATTVSDERILVENLPASVAQNDIIKNNSGNIYIIIVSLAFITTSASAVYFIRQKKVIPNAGDDFNILNE